MTSKNLFFSLCKEELKRKMWCLVMASVGLFFALPVIAVLGFSTAKAQNFAIKDMINDFTNIIGAHNGAVTLMVIAFAVIIGVSAFSYLASKNKIDLFHSIPVKREMLFTVNFVTGAFIFIVPYFVNFVITLVIAKINGCFVGTVVTVALKTFIINILGFWLIYITAVLAVVLTGNLIVSMLGIAVFYGYGFLVIQTLTAYKYAFFNTVGYSDNSLSYELMGKFASFSPLAAYIKVGTEAATLNMVNAVIYLLIPAVIITGLTLILYKYRASEAAGSAMAFKVTKLPIKVLITIPAAMLVGIFFRSLSYGMNDAWLIFGLITGLILVNGLIDVIYDFDIKAVFRNIKQIVIPAVILAVIVAVFRFDLTGYDKYMPSENEFESAAVSIQGVDEYVQYMDLEKIASQSGEYSYTEKADYIFENMKYTNYDDIYNLVEQGMKNIKERNTEIYTQETEATESEYYNSGQIGTSVNVNIEYNLKNGQKAYRTCPVDILKDKELLDKIYSSSEYKEGAYPLYKIEAEKLSKFSYVTEFGDDNISMTQEEQQKLIETYREEFKNVTFEQLLQTTPVGQINCSYNDESGNTTYEIKLYVYASFNKTLALLNKYGVDTDMTDKYDSIKSVRIYDVYSEDSENTFAEYKDTKEIKEILKNTIPSYQIWGNETIIQPDTRIEIRVSDKDMFVDNGHYFYYKNNTIPDKVLKDLGL